MGTSNNLIFRYFDARNYMILRGPEIQIWGFSRPPYFIYAEEGLIAEADATGTITREYGWKPQGIWGTDPVFLKSPRLSGGEAEYFYYQNDHLGTSQQLIDGTGQLVWQGKATAFGETVIAPGNGVENGLRFPGQYFEREASLNQNWLREYWGQTGRYIHMDPIGLKGGLNLYNYVDQNPLNKTDVTGLLSQCESGFEALNGMRYGKLHHEYSCWNDIKGNRVCRGFGRKENTDATVAIFSTVEGKILIDRENDSVDMKCTKDDGSKCMDDCVGMEYSSIEKSPPTYSWLSQSGETCQSVNRKIISDCIQWCKALEALKPQQYTIRGFRMSY